MALIHLILFLWIRYNHFATGTQNERMLYPLKHHKAITGGLTVHQYGLSLEQCINECFYRKRCKSINFQRHLLACELNSDDPTDVIEIPDRRGSVYSEKKSWNMNLLPSECQQCQEHERCFPGSSDVCVKQECAPPQLHTGERLLGNMFSVGCQYKVINDNTGMEQTFKCSMLPDVGTALGKGCKYSCLAGNSECLEGVCVCLDGYFNENGICQVCLTNVALGKTVSMCSVYDAMSPGSNAVNGIKTGDYYDGSCAITNKQLNPWMLLDLGKIYKIRGLQLVRRKDCCVERLRNLKIHLGITRYSTTLIYSHLGQLPAILNVTFSQELTGQILFIKMEEDDYLTLCEIEVYGTRC